jgi:hypothetical protein
MRNAALATPMSDQLAGSDTGVVGLPSPQLTQVKLVTDPISVPSNPSRPVSAMCVGNRVSKPVSGGAVSGNETSAKTFSES